MINDENKQASPAAEEGASAPAAEPKPRAKKTSPKSTGDSDFVRASTAQPAPQKPKSAPKQTASGKLHSGKDGKGGRGTIHDMPSTRPAHRAIPYILFGLAAFLAVCMMLNLFCNFGNVCKADPSAHLLGSVGYWICYVLLGLFGGAAFLIPALLLYLALFWKALIDNKMILEKTIVGALVLLFLGAFVHSFSFIGLPEDQWRRTASQLMNYGAELRGGGVIGGGIGYFFAKYMNYLGALIVGFFLTAITAFFFLGITPKDLWRAVRKLIKKADGKDAGAEKKEREDKKRKESEAADTPAEDKKASRRDVRRAADGKDARAARDDETNEEDDLAPMPMPVLDASDDTPVSNLYVPADIGRKMGSSAPVGRVRVNPSQPGARQMPGQRTPSAPDQGAPATGKGAPSRPVPPPPGRTAPPSDPNSMESVFPRSANEAREARRIRRDDKDFELGKIFIDLDDRKPAAVKKHAPLPPEAPLPAGEGMARRPEASANGAARRPDAAGQRTARPDAREGARRPAPGGAPTSSAAPTGQKKPITVRPATAPAGVRPSVEKGAMPIFRQSEKTTSEYGLSSEEFEKREASAQAISNAMAAKKKPAATAAKSEAKPAAESKKTPAAKTADAKKPTGKTAAENGEKPYIFPPISYLHPSEPMTAENHSEIKSNMEKLYATLSDFNVRINEITYSCGPTVTRYEIYPSAGVRVRTITNLADDIALSFAVQSVRMEAIPGKSAIGVEVPNTTRQTVYLRELLESPAFTEKPSRLTAGLGADVAGAPLLFDIAKMPHLLVAGATGMGKSVCINCIIMSILFKARPDQVKLILVDPKKVEFSLYKGIPHLMAPIIVTPKDAAGALQAAVNEMEDRFTKIQDVGVSNIDGYNKAAEKDPELPPMPHIVIIIDELADLMLTARDEVEDSICRLAQKARAAGMHIIVGTQRPSVDVVTGLIKSNIPSRVACTVASQVDSRTILDIAGAEKLLGKGDMLFAPVGAMKPTRVQGAFVSDAEVEKICEFIRATNGTAVYNEAFTSKMKEYSAMCGKKGKNSEGAGGVALPGESGDNKYVDAIRISIEENRVSTSLLQRKLGIGYSRAAKIIDRMEEEGLVSKADGSKARNILITAEQFIERYVEGDAGAEEPEEE